MFKTKSGLLLVLIAALLMMSVGVVYAQDDEDLPDSIRFGILSGPPVETVANLMVEQFNEVYPDIEVELEFLSGDIAAAFAAQAASGSLPDVIFLADLFVVPFVQGDIVIDMEPLAEADETFDLSDVYANMLDLSRVGGEGLYMIPSSFDVVTMYYNTTMFEEAGAPLPSADWTWDDYIAACSIIRAELGNYCLSNGTAQDAYQWWANYVPWISGYGGQLLEEDGVTVALDSPEVIQAMEGWTGLWTEHDIAQPLDFDAGGECFIVGECATTLFIPGYMGAVRALEPAPFDWDVEVIPTHPEGKFTGMGTFGFAVSSSSEYPELAWELVKGLVSVDTQITLAENYSGIPLLQSLREDPAIVELAGPPDNITAFIENGENGITPTYFPGECGSLYAGLIQQEIEDALEASILGMMSVEDAFTFADENIQRCLDRSIESDD